jgi:hypothetical protein
MIEASYFSKLFANVRFEVFTAVTINYTGEFLLSICHGLVGALGILEWLQVNGEPVL